MAMVYRNNCLICKVTSNHVGNLPTRTLSLPADFYDCSVICKNVEKHDGCDLFLFEDQICYLGKSSYTTGDVDGLKNATFWATSASLNSITSDVGLKDNVLSESWTAHIEESHSHSVNDLQQCQGLVVLEEWHYTGMHRYYASYAAIQELFLIFWDVRHETSTFIHLSVSKIFEA